MTPPFRQHSSHWGAFEARKHDGHIEIKPLASDPDPSPLLRNLPDALNSSCRILRPAVRKGWLENGPGADRRRGRDGYVEVSWMRHSTSFPANSSASTATSGHPPCSAGRMDGRAPVDFITRRARSTASSTYWAAIPVR